MAFSDLKAHYAESGNNSIVLEGYGGGGELGRIKVEIDIEAGTLSALFSDTIASGVKKITGQRRYNLENHMSLTPTDKITEASDYAGIYATRDDDEVLCANTDDISDRQHMKMILRTDVLPGPSLALFLGDDRHLESGEAASGSPLCHSRTIKFGTGVFTAEYSFFEFSIQNNSSNILRAGVVNLHIDPTNPQKISVRFFNFNGVYKTRIFYKVGEILTLEDIE